MTAFTFNTRRGNMPDQTEAAAEPESTPFAQWVILELMGHRRLAGYLTEQEIAGRGFLRLDVPAAGGQPQVTQLYNPTSVYCITPTTAAVARAVASGNRPAPVHRFELEVSEPPADAGWPE